MDIYSNSKNPKHKKRGKKTNKKASLKTKIGDFFLRIKEWFLSMPARKRAIVVALIAVILVLVIVASIILGYVIKVSNAYHHDDDFWIDNVEPISKDVTNIALFGLDTRDKNSFEGLSDSIMVLSLNKKTGSIKIVSVMRDSLVKIPGYENPRKINSAYSLGGPTLAVQTLNANFGLDITEYATVNFSGMADIIDAVGGIYVNVLKSELNAYNGLNHNIEHQAKAQGVEPQLVASAGYQKLNGMQAVAWARIRSVATEGGEGNDFGRTDRQRYVMEQLLNTATNMGVSEYPSLINGLLPYVKTSLSVSEIASLSTLLVKGMTFEESRIPQSKYIINGNFSVSGVGSTVYYNLDYAAKVLYAYLYEGTSPEDYMEQNGVDKTGWYGKSNSTTDTTVTSSKTSVTEDKTSSKTTTSKATVTSAPTSSATEEKTSSDKVVSEEASSEETVSEEASSEETVAQGDESSEETKTSSSEEEISSEEASSEASSTEEAPTDSETEVSKEPENSVESEETDTSEEPTDSAAEEPFEPEENETAEEAA